MSVFPNWQSFAVPQRRPLTGCIPTGYEIILRAANAQGIDFSTFQDEFDLDQDYESHEPSNNFENVAAAIQVKYPSVCFGIKRFLKGKGVEKLQFVEQHVSQKQLLLVALTVQSQDGYYCHIMPVVDMDEQALTLLHSVSPDGNAALMKPTKEQFVQIHDNYPGGDDVAYLESC